MSGGDEPDDVVALEVESDELIGEGGFLTVRRVRLRNRRRDGSLSERYLADFLHRPMGADAVAVCAWTRARGRLQVLVRDGLRIPLALARELDAIPVPDGKDYLFLTELVAGIIERGDRGEDGIRARAADELLEEAGYRCAPDAVVFLGTPVFFSPGAMAEKVWLTAVEIADPDAQEPLVGDGSAMEEGARTRWMAIDEALAACAAGTIEDAKTELGLRRLADYLRSS